MQYITSILTFESLPKLTDLIFCGGRNNAAYERVFLVVKASDQHWI